MDSNANIRKPLRARKTMSPSCRKQVEILRKLHGLGKNGSSTDSVDKYVQLRMVGTNVLNYGSYSKTNLNHALGETTKEPVAKLVVNSEISICNNSGDLSSDLPYKTNSEEEQFFNAGSLQDMLYTLYQNNPRNPVSRPVEVHLFSESSDQPLGGSKEQTSSLASPAGNLSAVVAAEERTEQIPDNHAVALLEHEALPDNTLRKRKPSGCEEDVTSKPCKSDEPAEDSKRRKTSECEEVVIQKCLGSSDEMAEGSRKRKTSECEEVVICKRLESSSEITEDSGTQLDKSQSGIDKVKCFIRSEIENVVGNLDHKVQQLNGRFDNTQSQQKDSRIAIRIVKKIAKLNRRVNSLMAFQQAQLLNKAICPGASAKNAILNAAKPVSGIPDNSSVPPSRLLHRAPPTTAQSSAKETSLTVEASGVQAGKSADVQQRRPSVNAGASANSPYTLKNMLVIDLTEEDANRDNEVSVNLTSPPKSIGPKPLQPATESSESVAKESMDPGSHSSGASSKVCMLPEKNSADNAHIFNLDRQISSPNIPASFPHLPPLPRTRLAPEHTNNFPNTLPPQKLEMAVVQVQNPKGIALQWNVNQVDPRCAPIKSFLLFMCHERTDGSPTPWIKIREIEALPLPMACSLSQFSSSGKCYFIMQSKDVFGRFGPFCDIQAISAA